jgi:hypothetical protein
LKKSGLDLGAENNKPFVTLGEDNGKAPTISYNVPEPTSYSGRYFVELKFEQGIFNRYIVDEINRRNGYVLAVPTATIHSVDTVRDAMINGFSDQTIFPQVGEYAGLIRLQNNHSEGEYEIKSNLPLSTELAGLTPEEVYSALFAGKSLMVYRSSFGTLTYDYINSRQPVMAADAPDVDVLPPPPPPPPPVDVAAASREIIYNRSKSSARSKGKQRVEGEILPHRVLSSGGSITITYPAKDQIIAGVAGEEKTTITVEGTTEKMTIPIGPIYDGNSDYQLLPPYTVEVKINSGEFEEATGIPEGEFSKWKFKKTFEGPLNTSGQKTFVINARALWGYYLDTGEYKTKEEHAPPITITVKQPHNTDRTPPTINITSPSSGQVIRGPNKRVPVSITGTAVDEAGGTGVKQVYVQIGSQNQYEVARPNTANWSSWLFSGIITAQGEHTITAKAVDNAGNEGFTSEVKIKTSFLPQSPRNPLYRPRLFLIESYRLSSFLGQYGAGRTIKTFSLLPGEKTKISVKTYLKTEQEAKQASSILESVTDESAKDFETTLAKEQSSKQDYNQSKSYEINAKAEASWGWGSAEVSGGVKGSTNASREEFAKNVSNTTQKHASKASAKREVQINTSFERKEQAGEETSIEREIENINLSRTLNFVFRQMNQEYITLLHLVDVRMAFWDGDPNPATSMTKEVALADLDSLLNYCIKKEKEDEVRQAIIDQLNGIFNYQGKVVPDFVQEMILRNGQGKPVRRYWKVNHTPKDEGKYTDETGNNITVQGIIVSANKYVMRTDGVIVEALLGQAEALDNYSKGLQDHAVRAKELENRLSEIEGTIKYLGIDVVKGKDAESAKIFGQVFPCCKPHMFSLWPPNDNENGQQRSDIQ